MSARPTDVLYAVTVADHADIERDSDNDAYLLALTARAEHGAKLKRRRDALREMLQDAEAAYAEWGNA